MAGFASLAGAEGEKITDVKVKGNRRIETAAILNVIKLKSGDYLYADKADADIRAIFKLGHFQDVKAESEKSEKGLTLIYTVKEKPVIRDITIEGNKELTVEKIKESLDIRNNSIYSAKDVAKGVKKLKKLYADEGYYLVEVESSTEQRSDYELALKLKINEGSKTLVQQIRFEGNHAFTPRKLRGVMETTEDWWLAWLTGAGVYKEEVAKNDVTLIADLYFNNGYINVKVGEPKIELMPDKKGLILTIGITEGEQFQTGELGFKGDLLEKQDELAKQLKLATGQVFSRATLRNDVFTLTDVYSDKGYAFANVTPITVVDPAKKRVNVTFDMEKGEKVFIDRINISGNPKTRDKVIRREIKLTEGDLFSSSALRKSKQNLMNLGYFEEANIATAKGSSDNKLNLNVDVKEKPTGTFSIGAGYSSLDGVIGQGSIQQANFLGLGLKANASASIGSKSQTYNVGLTDPYFMDTRWTVGADIYRSQRDYLDFTRRVTGGDIKAGYPVSDNVSTFWIYKYEEKEVFNLSQALRENINAGITPPPDSTSTTSSITASLTRNTTDYRLDPSKGMVNNISVEFAGIGGTNRYLRYIGSSTYFIPVALGSVLSLRGELGYIQGILGKEVSIDEKFYLGGINTVRGYPGRTISPNKISNIATTNANGIKEEVVSRYYEGGTTESVFNVEFQIPLLKEAGLKGVLFFDAGNAYAGPGDLFTKFQTSYGFGIRWFSPIGPLRLEYGIPLNPRDGIDNSSGKLEFSIGSFF
jgi:outer membrane protein insertion porin family